MSQFDAIIFDMDGVIVDSEPRHERAFLKVFDELGLGDRHGIHFPDYFGTSDRVLWADFVARHQPSKPLEELAGMKFRHFVEMIEAEKPLFPGFLALLDRIPPSVPLAVASGSWHDTINVVLALRDLRPRFRAVVSSQDVPKGKPAPDIFLRAAELLGANPGRCCVLEDSAAGVAAGKAAGMTVVGITNSIPAERLRGADHIVDCYEKVGEILLGN